MDFNNVDEWTDDDRSACLDLIRADFAEHYKSVNKQAEEMANLLARAQIDLEIMWEAQRECVRRYLDATGRGKYGNETLEHEIDFFRRRGESQIIFRYKPKPPAQR